VTVKQYVCNFILLQAAISDDSKYVVFIDRQDGSLHVVQLNINTAANNWSYRQVASCFTHAPSKTRLTLRCGGRVVAINDGPQLLCLLAIKDDISNETNEPIEYSSEMRRAVSILGLCRQQFAVRLQQLALNTRLEPDQITDAPLSSRRPLSNTRSFPRKLLPLADIQASQPNAPMNGALQ
jgi:hypothetical protein